MSGNMNKIGAGLVEHAECTPITSRGIIEELFPYIYVASKRMSTRAISEWLEKEQNVQLSHVSIARALKDSSVHFERIMDNIYAAADTLEIHCNYDGNVTNSSKLAFLFDEEYFEQIIGNMAVDIGKDINIGAILHAIQKIKEEWFALPKTVRDRCENICITRDAQRYDESRKAEFEKMVKERISKSSTPE